MKDFVILTDTRQQKEEHILKEFNKQEVLHIRTTLPSADYMALRHDNEKGFYMDYTLLIDTKKDLEEMASNLCNTVNHERIKREVAKAKELGCKYFIFLIANNKIKTIDDLKSWTSKHTKVKGITLLKIMATMTKKYEIKFVIVPKKEVGKKIIQFLKKSY